MAAPTLAPVTYPVGRETKTGRGSVPLNSATLGLLVSDGGAAITSWTISQTSGPNEWTASVTNTPSPSTVLTVGSTATFTVTATNASGTSSPVTLTINVQSAAARAAFNVGSQADVTNVQPTTGALDKLADKELWLSVGATAWENAQLTLRRIRPRDTQPATYAYVRNADPARPVALRDIKLLGCNGVMCNDLTPTWDDYGSSLVWATVDGGFDNREVHFDGFIGGARTKDETLNNWPDFVKLESPRTASVTNFKGDCFQQLVKIVAASTTHNVSDNITITGNEGRRFRNNFVFVGAGSTSKPNAITDGVVVADNIAVDPSQYSLTLHMDFCQLSGSANTGSIRNVLVTRNILLNGAGLCRTQFFFGRTDYVNDYHDNIIVKGNIGLIGAVWGAYDGPGNTKLIEGNLFIFDPNNWDATGTPRTRNLGGGLVDVDVTRDPRVGFNDYPDDTRWADVTIKDNILQNDPQDYIPLVVATGNFDIPMTAGVATAFAGQTALFNDPAAIRKEPAVWSAMTVAQIKAEVIRCVKPKVGSIIADIGPLTTDGQWRYGGEYIPPVDVPDPEPTPSWTEIPANNNEWTQSSIAVGGWTVQPIASTTWS